MPHCQCYAVRVYDFSALRFHEDGHNDMEKHEIEVFLILCVSVIGLLEQSVLLISQTPGISSIVRLYVSIRLTRWLAEFKADLPTAPHTGNYSRLCHTPPVHCHVAFAILPQASRCYSSQNFGALQKCVL